MTAVAFLDTGDVITGDSNGNLFIWYRGGVTVAHSVWGAHVGPVGAVVVGRDGRVVSGGRDGRVVLWDQHLNKTGLSAQVGTRKNLK